MYVCVCVCVCVRVCVMADYYKQMTYAKLFAWNGTVWSFDCV